MGRSLVKWLLWGLIVLVHLHGHRGCFEEDRKGLLEIKEEFVRSSPNVTLGLIFPPRGEYHLRGEYDLISPLRRSYSPFMGRWPEEWVLWVGESHLQLHHRSCDHLSLHNFWEIDTELVDYFYFINMNMAWFLKTFLYLRVSRS